MLHRDKKMKRPESAWHIVICVTSVYVALLLNSTEAARRFSAHEANYASPVRLVALELLLILFTTGALFYLASLAGRVIFKTVVAFVLVFSAVSAYYMIFFHVVIGFGIVQATLTTDVDLSREAVGAGAVAFVLLLGILPAAGIAVTRLTTETLAGRIVMLAACGLMASLIVFVYPGAPQNIAGHTQLQMASPLGVVMHSYVPSNWVTGLAMSGLSKYESAARRTRLMDPAKNFTYRAGTNLDGTYLVIVIGESARYDRMGILGHSRSNTPEMARTANLVSMQATSCNTSTKLSLQCMFVRPEAVDDGGVSGMQSISEEMVFTVLKKLGFTSELFAMQGEVWFYNSVDPDNYKHREIIYARDENIGKPVDDLLLIRELRESIARHPRGRHLVILHTKGSHHLYTERYPRSYAWYQPECASTNVPCAREELLNSYDNSIAYTDHFLGQVIRQPERQEGDGDLYLGPRGIDVRRSAFAWHAETHGAAGAAHGSPDDLGVGAIPGEFARCAAFLRPAGKGGKNGVSRIFVRFHARLPRNRVRRRRHQPEQKPVRGQNAPRRAAERGDGVGARSKRREQESALSGQVAHNTTLPVCEKVFPP